MHLSVITLAPDADGRFDDSALREFSENHEVMSVQEHHFLWRNEPRWAFLVTYRQLRETGQRTDARRGDERADPTSGLGPEAIVLYERLRAWRNERAEQTGKPSYVIAKNRLLAEIASKRPTTASGLRELRGIGDGWIDAYATEVLALLVTEIDPTPALATDEG